MTILIESHLPYFRVDLIMTIFSRNEITVVLFTHFMLQLFFSTQSVLIARRQIKGYPLVQQQQQ